MQAKKLQEHESMQAARDFLKIVRNCALGRLSALLGRSDLTAAEVGNDQELSEFYWVSNILIAWPGAKVTFKVYYMSNDAADLLATQLGRPKDVVNKMMSADFVREYCNVTGGAIKALVAATGAGAGISLPVVMMGFDEYVASVPSKRDEAYDKWLVNWQGGRLGCSSAIHVRDWPSFTSLQQALLAIEPAKEEASEGEVEFL